MRVLSHFTRPLLAIDAGTAVTRVCSMTSVVIERPSTIVEASGGGDVARPALRRGVICDISAAADVLAPAIRRLASRWRRPAALVCAPSDVSSSERDALVEAVATAGASVTTVVPEPLAAAIGAGVDVGSEYAHLVVDVGDGVTDAAVIAGGTILRSEVERTGCSDIRQTLIDWLAWHGHLTIEQQEADALLRAYCASTSSRLTVAGLGTDGRPVVRTLDRDDVGSLVEPGLETIAAFVAETLRRLPDPVAVEVIESGVALTGGGAALDLLARRVEVATRLTVVRPKDPLRSVIRGAREMLRSGVVPDAAIR